MSGKATRVRLDMIAGRSGMHSAELDIDRLLMRSGKKVCDADKRDCRPGKINDAADFCQPEFSECAWAK